MKARIITTCMAAVLLFAILCSCSGGGGEGSPDILPPDTDGTETNAATLSRFDSDADLAAYLKQGLLSAEPYDPYVLDDAPAPAEGGNTAGRYSMTNLQESDVDEADTIKSDGRYLYVLAPGTVLTPPPDVVVLSEAPEPALSEGAADAIRILSLSNDPAEAVAVGEIPLTGFEMPVTGLYLVLDDAGGMPDLLVTVGSRSDALRWAWDCISCWQSTRTEVGIFDVTERTAPIQIAHITLDGRLVDSRRIGRQLYLVSRFSPRLPTDPENPADGTPDPAALEAVSLDALLPKITGSGMPETRLIPTETCYLPPPVDEAPQPTLVTVTAIDLSDPDNWTSCSIAGPTETVYASAESLFLATTRYRYAPVTNAPATESLPPETTDIHRFSLGPAGPVYTGSGAVTGHLGWETDKKPFRFSEHEGVLRVATSIGDTWNDTARTRLTLLKPDPEGALVETAHIDHIGEPGENLYAARFAGDRAYLVTFLVTDPLYVFDLSDPYQPMVLGELHIDGYSDYLHPVSDGLLLGIGKDAVPDAGSIDFGGRGAWYQGVKLSLFDVSDPARPVETAAVVLGKRGTESDALHDHHALAWLPATDGMPARLALPVVLHDTPVEGEWWDPSVPWTTYDWTHTGLYLFEISASGIAETGRMVVADRTMQPYPDYSPLADRAVLLENSAHYIHHSRVWSAPWGDAENLTGPN